MNASDPGASEEHENGAASAAGGSRSPRLPPRIPDHELLRVIGRGAYGEVWLARSIMGEYRAVKVVYRRSFEHDRPYEREFAGIQKFEPISRSHESQVDILHVGRNEGEGYFYYVMELADDANAKGNDGVLECRSDEQNSAPPPQHSSNPSPQYSNAPSLHRSAGSYVPRTLKHELHQRGRLPVAECVKLGLSLTTALDHLHRNGLVHRDVKPSNIIFVNGQPKLADIGLVTGTDATRSYVGTLGFAPPEGPGSVTADLYSLGKVLYEAATGRDRQEFPELPTRLGSTQQQEADLVELNEVFLKACDNDPSHRYQSAEAMRIDLAALERGHSLVRKRIGRRRLVLLAKAGVGTLAVAGVVVLASRHYLPNYERSNKTAKKSVLVEQERKIPDVSAQFEDPDSAVRARGEQYPRLTPGTEVGKSTFTTFILDAEPIHWGNHFLDAIRFTTPPDAGLDMAWAFNLSPGTSFQWALQSLNGPLLERGFRRFFPRPNTRYENVPRLEAPGKIFVQGLPGKWLEPSRDYLLMFRFTDANPQTFRIAVNFVPAGFCSETNLDSLEKALGLIVNTNQLEAPNPAGATNR